MGTRITGAQCGEWACCYTMLHEQVGGEGKKEKEKFFKAPPPSSSVSSSSVWEGGFSRGTYILFAFLFFSFESGCCCEVCRSTDSVGECSFAPKSTETRHVVGETSYEREGKKIESQGGGGDGGYSRINSGDGVLGIYKTAAANQGNGKEEGKGGGTLSPFPCFLLLFLHHQEKTGHSMHA